MSRYLRRRMTRREHFHAFLLLALTLAALQFAVRGYYFAQPAAMLVGAIVAAFGARGLRRMVLSGDILRRPGALVFFENGWQRWPLALITSVESEADAVVVKSLLGERRFELVAYRNQAALRALSVKSLADPSDKGLPNVFAGLVVLLMAFGVWRGVAERTHRFESLLASPPPAYLDLQPSLAPVVEAGGELACAAQRQLMERADAELRMDERDRHRRALAQCTHARVE
ncbi:MAG: hypothetical protein AAF411_09065 [Myxococcota bacterium]